MTSATLFICPSWELEQRGALRKKHNHGNQTDKEPKDFSNKPVTYSVIEGKAEGIGAWFWEISFG